jgi:DNA polymerase-1
VEFTEEQAETFRRRFFETYTGIRWWQSFHGEGRGPNPSESRTIGGRRRLGVESFTQRCNTPVQGSAADGMKNALALLWETRDRCPEAAPVLVVHDEVVLECPADAAEEAKAWLVECLERGMGAFLRLVPAVAEATIARDWAGTPADDDVEAGS